MASAAPVVRPPRIEPIDAERHVIRMTVGPEFMAELAEVKAALSHVVPDGNLETLLRACFRKTLETCRRRKQATGSAPVKVAVEAAASAHPAEAPMPPACSSGPEQRARRDRYIPAAIRRAVWTRDQGCCAFIGSDGKRCGSRHQLEFDHLEPFARGGATTVENLALRCRAHNLLHARRDFGANHMARFSKKKQRQEPLGQRALLAPDEGAPTSPPPRWRGIPPPSAP
jgi:hypothetical protein